ncbi:MAG: DUF6711 family protein [Aeromonadaceae bacterium]
MNENQYRIWVNGTLLPIASSVDIGLEDLDRESGRSVVDGRLIRQRVRANVVKLSCQWLSLTDIELKALLNAASPVTFSLQYYDTLTGTLRTITAYAGPKNVSLQRVSNGIRYSDVSVNFIEV